MRAANAPPLRETTYAEAIEATKRRKRYLLLGNGFSIAAHPAFRYDSLLGAGGPLTPSLSSVFKTLETTDFEVAIKGLQDAINITKAYVDSPETFIAMSTDVEAIKRRLIAAIAAVHPARANEIADEQKEACVVLLQQFIGKRAGAVFTLNYDLLLYWVAARHWEELGCQDGFSGRPLRWSSENGDQKVFWLHGGLHLRTDATGIAKLAYKQQPLIAQINEGFADDVTPLFVSEGDSKPKLARIRDNEYLSHARRTFAKPAAMRRVRCSSTGCR